MRLDRRSREIASHGITTTLVLVLLAAVPCGCGSVAVQKPYTEQELQAECRRHGGWWRPDELRGGFCEYRA